MSFVEFDKTLPRELRNQIADYIQRHYALPAARYLGENCATVCEASIELTDAAMPMATVGALTLEDALKNEDMGFSEALLKLIDKAGKKDSEIYKKANISKQHFSKIRNNPHYNPSKPTAIALALALELDLEDTKELIGRAGFALTNSSKFDLIIQFFIQKKIYNITKINMALYEFDQTLLGV